MFSFSCLSIEFEDVGEEVDVPFACYHSGDEEDLLAGDFFLPEGCLRHVE